MRRAYVTRRMYLHKLLWFLSARFSLPELVGVQLARPSRSTLVSPPQFPIDSPGLTACTVTSVSQFFMKPYLNNCYLIPTIPQIWGRAH